MIKSEHNGAKNGGGYWGTRAEAKAVSSQQRRQEDRAYRAVRATTEHGRCRVVSPFCSPAYLPRRMAASVLAADLELYEAMMAAGAVPEGMQRPYTEG